MVSPDNRLYMKMFILMHNDTIVFTKNETGLVEANFRDCTRWLEMTICFTCYKKVGLNGFIANSTFGGRVGYN